VIEISSNREQFVGVINILTEVIVVDLINVTLVHISLQENVEDILRGADTELLQSSQELMLGNVLVLGDVEIHEHRL
jgi:hypothetical protein